MNVKVDTGSIVEYLSKKSHLTTDIVIGKGEDIDGPYISFRASPKVRVEDLFIISIREVRGVKEWLLEVK